MQKLLKIYKLFALIFLLIGILILLFNPLHFINNFSLYLISITFLLHAMVIDALLKNKTYRLLVRKVFLVFLSFPLMVHLIALFNAEVFANSYPLYFGGIIFQFWFLIVEKNKLMSKDNLNLMKRILLFVFSLLFISLILLVLISPLDPIIYEIMSYVFLPIIFLGSWLIWKK